MNRTVLALAILVLVGVVVLVVTHEPADEVNVLVALAEPEQVDEEHEAPESADSSTNEIRLIRNRPVEVLAGGFASASSCTRCHEEQHRSWHASFHRTMTQTVTPESVPPGIESTQLTISGVDYEFSREGDQYFVKFDDPIDPSSEALKKQLVLMTGSHHMHVFWYESPFDRTPAMLPIVYLRDQQRWIVRNAAFVRPPSEPSHELGRWNQTCSRCHSTHPRGRVNKQTSAWDTHVVDFGIACEACHGPGENHIRIHDSTAGVDVADDVVVNPEDLPHHLKSDVCGQCHSVHLPKFESYSQEKLMTAGMPFRPGDNFEDSPLRELVRKESDYEGSAEFAEAREDLLRNSFWADGAVRVAGREYNGLVESACYLKGEMSCLSCHEMHPDDSIDLDDWRDDQLKPGMRTDHACTQCHAEARFTDQLAEHTHHAVDSHGSRCMNCHMPRSTYGLLKAIRSHRIESPSVLTTLNTGRPNGCVLCHLDQDIGWAADHLSQWYGQQELELKNPLARETASGIVNLLMGDAGLRAIYASNFAWQPAREASGSDWMAPYLMLGLIDEYDAVRIITKRTLQTLPGYENLEIDEFADIGKRAEAVNRYLDEFKQNIKLEPRSKLLIDREGKILFERASEMFNSRDQTPIFLQE